MYFTVRLIASRTPTIFTLTLIIILAIECTKERQSCHDSRSESNTNQYPSLNLSSAS